MSPTIRKNWLTRGADSNSPELLFSPPTRFLLGLCLFLAGACGLIASPSLRGNLGIHDPSTIIKCKDKYYIFGTGQGIISKSSSDKIYWTAGTNVFANPPAWTTNAVPGFSGLFWAPDVFFLNGRYCLYYAVSTWASQVSAIGLVTNPTLDPADPAYKWTDQGVVIQSGAASPFNTIDPSVTLDAAGNPWMAFGSYWSGIYLVQLDPNTGLRIASGSPTYRLAYNSSIEASCVYRHGGYYYLFVNWGSCCSGVNSTYHIRVGRSANITGPYLDRAGVDLANNGGTLFLQGTGKFTGPGHVGILSEGGSEWFSYHYYDAGDWDSGAGAFGKPKFDLVPLSWASDNWPVFTNDWSAVYHFQADARDENGQYYGLLLGGASTQTDAVRGRVLNLNGTNQFVQLPAGVAYARTFAAVVKWNGGGAWQRLFDFGTDTSGYVMLTPSSGTGKLRCDIRANNTTQVLEGPGTLPVGTWAHVAVTLDGQRGVLYLNGQAVATNASMTLSPLDVRAQTNHLGHSKFTADPDFSGQFASFRVYGRALSAAEIVAPQPVITQPTQGATYQPGDTVRFAGGAADFFDQTIAANGLSWTVQFCYNGVTNPVQSALVGVTNGTFTIPGSGPAATNGFYRIGLTATDAAGRKATTFVEVFPGASSIPGWASYYPFTTGAQDASNRFNGSLFNGASIATDATRGKVLNLSGASQYVSLPAGAGTFQTFSAWVKWNGGAAWQRILDFGQNNNDWLFLTPLDSDGKMQCAISTDRSSYVQVIQAPARLPTGVWTHLALAFDGRQGILYSNGVAVAVNNSVNLLPSDVISSRNYFGRSQYSVDPYFSGQLDAIRLNSRPLSPAELLAPMPVITQPATGALYAGGDTVAFAGMATDYSENTLPATALSWSIEFHQDNLTEPFLGPIKGVSSGALNIPITGPASTNVFYRLNLTATDGAGLSRTVSADLLPQTSLLNLATVPPGLAVALDGQILSTPAMIPTVVGMSRVLNAPSPQTLMGSNYSFILWSDGGAATHAITVATSNLIYTASFVTPALGLNAAGTNLALSWPGWAGSLSLYSATNLAPPVLWRRITNASTSSNGLQVISLPGTNSAQFYRLQSP